MPPHSTANTLRFGTPLARAEKALILVHGRGSSAEDIAGLADALPSSGISYLAPSADQGTWYPQRFLVPPSENEPWLSSAISVIDQLVQEAIAAGIGAERIGLIGFSQGACLSLEFCARHPRHYALVGGLSGALIGPLEAERPIGDLQRTPVLLGCAEKDAHIPIAYVLKSAEVLSSMNAAVTKQIYRGANHAVYPQEIDWLKQHL